MTKYSAITILLSVISTSCLFNKPPETVPQESGISLKFVGLATFGSVILGEERETRVFIKNNTQNSLFVSPIAEPPFYYPKNEDSCYKKDLNSGSSCYLNLKFKPEAEGAYSATISVGNSSLKISGSGIIGGDLRISEEKANIGTIQAGVEIYKTITLTNLGDYTLDFPSFKLPSDIKIVSNYCGTFLKKKSSCDVNLQVIKSKTGEQSDVVEITSTAKGSGEKTLSLEFNSVVIPGIATGTIDLVKKDISFTANGSQTESFSSTKISDDYGNTVSDGTEVIVEAANLSIVGEKILKTKDGVVSFTAKSNQTKGPASIALISGNAFGKIPFYVRSDLPFGVINLQPYSEELIADGETEIFIKTEKIYDKFRNPVEDGTEIDFYLDGGGSLSTDRVTHSSIVKVKTFDGVARFYLKSGTQSGPAALTAQANPYTISGSSSFLSTGEFYFRYLPGGASGDIPILSSKEAIDATSDFAVLTVGPILDDLGNVVKINTKANVSIINGKTINETKESFTDSEGKFQLIVVGSGNRGAIDVKVNSAKAYGEKSIWAYSDSHLTFYGQKRDDVGIGQGNNKINSARAFIRHSPGAVAQHELPSLSILGQEVFDYGKMTSSDSTYAKFQKLSRNSVSTAGNSGYSFPVKIPSDQGIENIVNYTELKPVPSFLADVFYSAGSKIISAPFWTKSVITPGTSLFGCGSELSDQRENYFLNSLQLDPATADYSCRIGNKIVTSANILDREVIERSNLQYSSIGYIEDPLGCSFEDGETPIYNFSMGEFKRATEVEKIIKINNPSPIDAQRLTISLDPNSSNGWSIVQSECPDVLAAKENCGFTIKFSSSGDTPAGIYIAKAIIDSSIVPIELNLSIQITANTTSSGVSGGPLGGVDVKSNCFSRLAVFGGHTYEFTNVGRTETNARTTRLLSLYNSKGQSVGRYDGICGGFQNKSSCESGFGCMWETEPSPTCKEKIDIGDFPSRGKSFSPLVPVGRKMYMFSGYDPLGDGTPSTDGLFVFNAESDSWSRLTVEQNEAIPEDVEDPLLYKEPQSRYLHGSVYVPENKSLYIYGGVGVNNKKLNDLWKVTLFPDKVLNEETGESSIPNLKWELVCMDCLPLPGKSIFSIIRKLIMEGIGLSSGEPTVPYLVWNRAHQKMFVFFKGRSESFSLNPLASSVEETIIPLSSETGAKDFAFSNQVILNNRDSRIYGYFKDNELGINYFKLWDMDQGEKAYLRIRFKIGAPAKLHAKVLTPRVRAYGSSGPDISGTCGIKCEGIIAYVYNHDKGIWYTVGDHGISTPATLTRDKEILASFNDEDAKELISQDGFVDLMVSTKGIPGEFNQMFVDSIFLDGTF